MNNCMVVFIQKTAIIVWFPHRIEQILRKYWMIFFHRENLPKVKFSASKDPEVRDVNGLVRSVLVRFSSVHGLGSDRGPGLIGHTGLWSGPRSHKKNFSVSLLLRIILPELTKFPILEICVTLCNNKLQFSPKIKISFFWNCVTLHCDNSGRHYEF